MVICCKDMADWTFVDPHQGALPLLEPGHMVTVVDAGAGDLGHGQLLHNAVVVLLSGGISRRSPATARKQRKCSLGSRLHAGACWICSNNGFLQPRLLQAARVKKGSTP
jgi:hypothetical protein